MYDAKRDAKLLKVFAKARKTLPVAQGARMCLLLFGRIFEFAQAKLGFKVRTAHVLIA